MPDEKPIGDQTAAQTGDAQATDRPDQTTQSGDAQAAKETERTDWKGMAIDYKAKAERLNEVEKELKELRQRAATPPTGYVADPQYQARLEAEKTLANLRLTAAQGDPASQAILMKMQEDQAERWNLNARIELMEVPVTDRPGVEKYWQSGDYRTVAAARKAYLGDQLETREKERQASQARTAEVEAAKKARDASPETATRTVAAPKSSDGTIPFSQWQKELDEARARNDFAKMRELRSSGVQARLAPG